MDTLGVECRSIDYLLQTYSDVSQVVISLTSLTLMCNDAMAA